MKISNWIKTLGDLLYPANKVGVSETPTPDYTPLTLGDTMQDVTNKVAGLQRGEVLADIVVDAEINGITIENLNVTENQTLLLIVNCDNWPTTGNNSGYSYMRINELSSANYNTYGYGGVLNDNEFRWLPVNKHKLHLLINTANGKVIINGQFGANLAAYSIVGEYRDTGDYIESITSLRLFTSSLCSYKAGDNIKLYRI